MNDDRPMTLRDVARAALDAHQGVSGRELDRLARKRGLSISYTTVNHLAAGTYKSRPSRNTLEALAELSGIPLAKVYEAANAPMPMARLADQLPPDADLLSPAQREAVIAVVRQFAAANRALHEREDVMGNAEHPAPTSSPAEILRRIHDALDEGRQPSQKEARALRNALVHFGSDNLKVDLQYLNEVNAVLALQAMPPQYADLSDESIEAWLTEVVATMPDNVRELPAAARTVKGGSRTRRARDQQDQVETGSQVRDNTDDWETP